MAVRSKAVSILTCSVLAASVYAYVHERSLRPTVPQAAETSSFDVAGHECIYAVADGDIQYILVFDGDYFHNTASMLLGSGKFSFELPSGMKFKMEHLASNKMNIDNTEYDLKNGRIFFVSLGGRNRFCRHFPTRFTNCGLLTEKWKDCVRANLTLARAGLPELDALLQPAP